MELIIKGLKLDPLLLPAVIGIEVGIGDPTIIRRIVVQTFYHFKHYIFKNIYIRIIIYKNYNE